jgi:N-acetyl sugar amidotransferase
MNDLLSERICSSSILNEAGDPNISFDESGTCNYVQKLRRNRAEWERSRGDFHSEFLRKIERIKALGEGAEFDCILGLSGGFDSSFVAYLAWKNGLRPLVVHMDNGWNSELAVKNIENILRTTGFKFHNFVVDWEEFKSIQLAYLKASVVDVEVVTDHAINAVIYEEARKRGIRSVLIGTNPYSEGLMPIGWTFPKFDLENMRGILAKYGNIRKFKSYPFMGTYQRKKLIALNRIEQVELLINVDARFSSVIPILESEFNWKKYRWKHCESVFTSFYQGQLLPVKFKIDKRRAHLSDLIMSSQITRDEALRIIEEPYYETENDKSLEFDFVCKKLNISAEEMNEFLSQKPIPHSEYGVEKESKVQSAVLVLYRALGLLRTIPKRGVTEIRGVVRQRKAK